MSTSTRITNAQYDEMIRRGQFEPREEHRVELIYGDILPMSPIGPSHAYLVGLLNEWSFDVLPRKAIFISPQGTIGIPALDSEPQPDLLWTRRRNYSAAHPSPADILLLIEVADSSLSKDRGLKTRLYAEAGISDYWIVNVKGKCVEVRRDPIGSSYTSIATFHVGQNVHPLAFPDVSLPVSLLFPD